MDNYEDRLERQTFLDDLMRLRGQDNHKKENKRLDSGDTVAGRAFGSTAIKGFHDKITKYLEDQTSGRHSRSVLVQKIVADQNAEELELLVNPRDLAKIIVKCILNSVVLKGDDRVTAVSAAFRIGEFTEFLLNEQQLDLNSPQYKRGTMQRLGKQDRAGDEDEVRKAINFAADNVGLAQEWDEAEHLAVGETLLQLFLASDVTDEHLIGYKFSDLFVTEYVKTRAPRIKTDRFFKLSDDGEAWLSEHDEFVRALRVSFLPMLVKPRDWDTTLTGGFHCEAISQRYTFVKGQSNTVTSDKINGHREGFEKVFKAVNALQSTPFRVNETVHKALEYVLENKVELSAKGCPSWVSAWTVVLGAERAEEYMDLRQSLIKVDGRYDDTSWESLMTWLRTFIDGDDKAVLKGWRDYRLDVKKVAIGNKSRSLMAKSVLNDSSLFIGEDEMYFPYNIDSRTRIYPLSGQFSPQGSDVSKGLIEFANGVKIETEEQVRFIAVQLANTFGVDKVSLDDRVMWVLENEDEILASAEDFRLNQFWIEADAPFSALLACLEWKKYVDEGLGFTSNLPIAFDGSNNALQHISSGMLDSGTAQKVNLVDSMIPADIYQDIADRMMSNVGSVKGKNARRFISLDASVDGKISNRKVPKKSVMCLGYSISKRSSSQYCRDAITEMGLPFNHADLSFVKKNIGNFVWKAMEDELTVSFVFRDFVQSMSTEVIEAGLPVSWVTPVGFPCGQRYREVDHSPNRVTVTVDGKKYERKYPKLKTELDVVKNANALAPNIIHSFDSSHLQMTVNASVDEAITDFLMIHDSFATNAVDAERFSEIIREQFVSMYDTDHFNRIRQDFADQLEDIGVVMTTATIERGDFDLTLVLTSTHFFR